MTYKHDRLEQSSFKGSFYDVPTSNKKDNIDWFQVNRSLREMLQECILCNTDVRIETDDVKSMYVPNGQGLEVGMINFLIDNEVDVQREFINRNIYQPALIKLPFDQKLKRKTVVRYIQDPNQVRIYTKGAPEYLLPLCSNSFGDKLSQLT